MKRRDPDVLRAIVNDNARPLYRAARGMGFRDDEAEDLAQEVFKTFLETLDRYEGLSQVRTWLFGILHRKILERRRERRREESNDPIDAVFESRFDGAGSWAASPLDLDRLIDSREMGTAIQACLDALPAPQREVFVLREMEEMGTAEICKIVGVSVTNCGVLLHRARNRLRECLESRGWTKGTG